MIPAKSTPANIELPLTINVSRLSQATREVLIHFGLEAPAKLNQYCCALEDALLEQIEEKNTLRDELRIAQVKLEMYMKAIDRKTDSPELYPDGTTVESVGRYRQDDGGTVRHGD